MLPRTGRIWICGAVCGSCPCAFSARLVITRPRMKARVLMSWSPSPSRLRSSASPACGGSRLLFPSRLHGFHLLHEVRIHRLSAAARGLDRQPVTDGELLHVRVLAG